MARSAHELSREELHALVWSKPVQRAALEFGVSDVAVAKVCRRLQIPLPPRGYWARKDAGQDIPVPVLPVFVPPPSPPRRISAAEQRDIDRKREEEERRRLIAERHAAVPLVCFIGDVARMLSLSVLRIEAHLSEGGFPIEQIPYFGLLRKAKRPRRRGEDHEARPCWFKGRVLEFLQKPEWEQGQLLELPSERVARTCTHCPVHCPARHHEHPFARRWRNAWRGGW